VNSSLPPLLMTSERDSFAQSTIVERKPQIIQQVVDDNDYPQGIVQALDSFAQEIAFQPARLLAESESDAVLWNQALARYKGNTWLELPWYLAESFFYRRLLGVVKYFAPGPWQGHDPFGDPKRRQAAAAVDWVTNHWDQMGGANPGESFEPLLHSSLWGNRADLSNYTVREQVQGGTATRQERHNILIDHSAVVAAHLTAGVSRVDFINDNVGQELLFDLALADFLLSQGWARRVVFHVKNYPFFVSDAMSKDVWDLVALLGEAALGQQLAGHLASGRLALEHSSFWTTCLMFDRMPRALARDLAQSGLVLIKGDVNYRRLLGDRHWPHQTRLEAVTEYFPAPFLVLRTLKGEIMVGLEPGRAEELAFEDPDWLINGKRGIIQFVGKS
jgi:hypothetical protein